MSKYVVTGFNPCCTGLAISAYSWRMSTQTSIVFQSLLYWISHFGTLRKHWNRHFGICFNPCCTGLAISAPLGGAAIFQDFNVSILVVLD